MSKHGLIMESWRNYLVETQSNSDSEIIKRLKDKGWDENAIKYHKEMSPPFVEIEQIISNLDDYGPMEFKGPIPSDKMKISDEDRAARQGRYDDYKSGKEPRYFRDTDEDPDKMDFSNVTPVTLVQQSNDFYEVVDGIHRVFLAQKNNADLPAWVIKSK